MPELPEVEVLVRHLQPALQGRVIKAVEVRRRKVIAPASSARFTRTLIGCRFEHLIRRGKYLIFQLRPPSPRRPFQLIGHLGMTGRMYLLPADQPLPKHAAVAFSLGKARFVYEDTRYFGRMTLDNRVVDKLGPEPLAPDFTAKILAARLSASAQAIKVKLLDQSLVAGVGNIYASEALFVARIPPAMPARQLRPEQVRRLWRALRHVLREAIRFGSTVPLDWSGQGQKDGLFYYGRPSGEMDFYEERLRVYDREGQACEACGNLIQRITQTGRSTFYCSHCQK